MCDSVNDIRLDVGCGDAKRSGWTGLDRRERDGVDIVHDVEIFPWPFDDDSCSEVLLSHLWEHIQPKYRVDVMDEIWRITKPNGKLTIMALYAGSPGESQDPTHYPCPNATTFTYFDPTHPMYRIYKPRPWRLVKNRSHDTDTLEVVLTKRGGQVEHNEFKLCVLVPTTGLCRASFTFSLANLVSYYAQNRVYEDAMNQSLNVEPIEGSGISANRERLVEGALSGDTTHILFIDEDMSFAPDTLHILASRRLPVVGCNYKMRVQSKGFTALATDKTSRIITDEDSTGIEQCHYTGFGFCLIERWVFDKVERPWFLIGYNTDLHSYTTEDAGFARQLGKTGIEWNVDHDASKKVIHWGNKGFSWKEIDYGNVSGNI